MENKISIIIPVYNEWKTIRELLEQLLGLKLNKEIIVVDDGSSDGTSEILSSMKHPLITVYQHAKNRGKGAAIRTGLSVCTGSIVIIQDADLEQDPQDIYELVKPILNEGAQVVYGSRFLRAPPRMKWHAYVANLFLSYLTRVLYAADITDVETCYKVFRTEVLKSIALEAEGFEFEPEITAKILRNGISIREVPIKEDWFHGYDNNSKKVTWKDGVKAVWTLFKYRWMPLRPAAGDRTAAEPIQKELEKEFLENAR